MNASVGHLALFFASQCGKEFGETGAFLKASAKNLLKSVKDRWNAARRTKDKFLSSKNVAI